MTVHFGRVNPKERTEIQDSKPFASTGSKNSHFVQLLNHAKGAKNFPPNSTAVGRAFPILTSRLSLFRSTEKANAGHEQ